MATMPRDTSQRYVAASQACERKTRSSRSTSSNFVDSLLPTASSTTSTPSSAPMAKKIRLNSSASFRNDESSTVNSISETGIEPTSATVQSFLASSALSSLVFGNASGKEEKFENGNQSSGCDSSSPHPQSGRSSALGGCDETSGLGASFLAHEDEECSPPPVPINGNGEANGGNYFACVHCNKYFWTETSLKHHSSLYHSEKSFVCEICGKAFRFRSNLAEHRSVHTSLKPYVCKFCGKSSRLKGNLTKHILKHHKKEQNAYIGKDDIIIKKGKKSVKDPAAVDFLEKSMIVLTSSTSPVSISTAPLPATASGKQAPTATVSSSMSTGPFALNTADLGSAALQLLSMASKTEPNKNTQRSAKRSSSGQGLPSGAPAIAVNGSGSSSKTKSEKSSQQQRETSSIFGSATLKAQPFLPVTTSNGKSPNSSTKESNRFPMITSIGEDFLDSANYLLSSDTGPKFDYDEIFGSTTTKTQPTRDVDAIFESLLGRQLGQSEMNYSPPMDDLASSSPILNLASVSTNQPKSNGGTAASGGGVGTRCQLCGKHFRKAANLAVHMSIKHNQAPTALPVMTADSPPPPSSRAGPSADIAAMLNLKFPVLINQSISQQPKTSSISASSFSAASSSTNGKPADTSSKLAQRQNGSATPSTAGGSKMTLPATSANNRPAINPESIMQASSVLAATPQLDTLNGLMTKSGVSKDLKEIRNVLQELKRGLPDVAKLDELLSALDARVDRLERQLETSVNTLYILVQMQTDMNSAFCQFKNDVVQRLKSLKAQHADDEEEEEEEVEEIEEDEERGAAVCNGELEAEDGGM